MERNLLKDNYLRNMSMRKIYVKPSVEAMALESESIMFTSNGGVEDGPITGPVGARPNYDPFVFDDMEGELE